MIPRRVELENFLSFGGRQTIAFTDDEPLWVLCGPNGVGKSAVFDAMTFALFGQHRGGAQNADQLIRHGANSFLVVFEFEFNRAIYSVERGRDRRTPIQRVRRFVGVNCADEEESRNSDHWRDIDLTPFPGRDRIRGWAEGLLGLDYAAFTASVMLRQGEADRIITAQRRHRFDFLRQLVGAERYQRLHERVHAAGGNLRARRDAVTAELDHVPEVTAEQLAEAAAGLQRAAERLETERAAQVAAAVRVEQARRWNGLVGQRAAVEQQLRDADARAGERERIRQDYVRFDLLSRVLAVAGELVGLRDGLKRLDAEIARITGELNEATAARDDAARGAEAARERARLSYQHAADDRRAAERLREQITRVQRLVALADEVALLEEQAEGFPAGLDADHAAAVADVQRLTEERRAAGERRAAAAGLLRAAETRRRDIDAVEVGAECSRCGQPVSEEHARRERAELDADISRHRADRDAAQTDEDNAARALHEATTDRDRLAGEVRERDRVCERLRHRRELLAAEGTTADAAALRAEITEWEREAARFKAAAETAAREQREAVAAATRHDADRQRHGRSVTELDRERTAANGDHTRDAARRDVLLSQLPDDWRARYPTLTRDELDHDRAELGRLQAADIASRFQQLEQDDALRAEWERQCDRLTRDISLIPTDAHCPVADAERAAHGANDRLRDAAAAHAAARDLDAQRHRDAGRRRDLTRQHDELTRTHRRHEILARQLGPNGLQLALVRRAEDAIARFANDTLRNLSRGDLSIELDRQVHDNEALGLVVRQTGDPTPIGVDYLSGSQKFRVAVAVALAVGRFASGQARPLESVIIDEGFGSLDRDGLQAMAEELRNLQQSQDLRRLILVSHQEDFTAGFPVGYRLERGEDGTTAERFRREGGASAV